MRNILLTLLLFFFSGCSFNQFFLSEEVDKVTVVKYQSHLKEHRAYFKRDNLKLVTAHDKYLFLYHAKKHELGLVLHSQNSYKLYNFTKPEKPVITLSTTKPHSYKKVLKEFSALGFKPVKLNDIGYTAKVALRKYKGVKTLMVETKDYSTLQNRYQEAIRTYNANKIMSQKGSLPKSLIYPYFETYKAKAPNPQALAELQTIAKKLRFEEEEAILPDEVEEKVIFSSAKGYDYYLYRAPINELERYLKKDKTKSSLTHKEYQALSQHLQNMKEEQLLNEGSLEELIAAYKINKSPQYKKRIMSLLKETQENQ